MDSNVKKSVIMCASPAVIFAAMAVLFWKMGDELKTLLAAGSSITMLFATVILLITSYDGKKDGQLAKPANEKQRKIKRNDTAKASVISCNPNKDYASMPPELKNICGDCNFYATDSNEDSVLAHLCTNPSKTQTNVNLLKITKECLLKQKG